MARRCSLVPVFVGVWAACAPPVPSPPVPPPAPLVHLADRLDEVSVESASHPVELPPRRRWSFAEGRGPWRPLAADTDSALGRVDIEQISDGIRLTLSPSPRPGPPLSVAGIRIDLQPTALRTWEAVEVRARTRDRFAGLAVAYNVDETGAIPGMRRFFLADDDVPPIFDDGSEQRYRMPLEPREGAQPEVDLESLAILFGTPGTAAVDVLDVSLVPRGTAFAEPLGVSSLTRGGTTRDTIFAHAPVTLRFPVTVPPEGRLDVGLTVRRGDELTYAVRVEDGEGSHALRSEAITTADRWSQRSVDLADFAGREVELLLEATGDEGMVALWGAPILSGRPTTRLPNVVFYVIDGGDADFMSLYGYGRPTTPFLEELAREGVVFERAHSSSTWTQPSTVSFMTSLHHSVLGGLARGVHSTAVPTNAITMAEHFRRGGYQTLSLTANPNAGRIVGLERGVDLLRDVETTHHSSSSVELQQAYWSFRNAYPGGPTWAHFQSTDVHEPNEAPPPFAGRFAAPDRVEALRAWDSEIWRESSSSFGTTSINGFYDLALERSRIDREAYFGTRRDRYDETMAHQDQALEIFVAELKARGEWERTILVIGSDHGHPAGTFARFGRGLVTPPPPPWEGALCDTFATGVPLVVLWPGTIEGGRRVATPVSMIDVLPTLLDLVGLPRPEVLQGHSLAPLLRGEPMERGPVILDEFRVDAETGEMVGNLEMIDGRWGASLEIAPVPRGSDPTLGRHEVPAGGRWGAVHRFFPEIPRLLLYDLEADPHALHAVNEEHPELVRRYRRVLAEHWSAQQALARRFAAGEAAVLEPEQLRQLEALGYIQ